MTAARQPRGTDPSALEIGHALVTELLANGLSPLPGRTLNTKALAERIAELLGAFAARKVAEAVAAERAKNDGSAALIQRAAELIKTSANLGNTGRSLSQLEAIAEAVAAERERCAAICRQVATDHYSVWAEVCETRIRSGREP
jgi:hypothetical protein